jgi:hypothetical protein
MVGLKRASGNTNTVEKSDSLLPPRTTFQGATPSHEQQRPHGEVGMQALAHFVGDGLHFIKESYGMV